MIRRLFPVFRKHLIFFVILTGLIIASSVTKGQTSRITSIIAGIVMIYIGLSFTFWIIKTPAKKSKEEVA